MTIKNETDLKKEAIKILDKAGIFNFPLSAGDRSKRGLPDRVVFFNNKAAFCEFKFGKNELSSDQMAFQEQCIKNKILYVVIRNIIDLEIIFKDYG